MTTEPTNEALAERLSVHATALRGYANRDAKAPSDLTNADVASYGALIELAATRLRSQPAPSSEEVREAVELLEAGLQHPPTMFYTRPIQMAAALRTVLDALAQARKEALEEAAGIAERDVDWTRFGKAGIDPWTGGHDEHRDYRLGIVTGRTIASVLRSRAGEIG